MEKKTNRWSVKEATEIRERVYGALIHTNEMEDFGLEVVGDGVDGWVIHDMATGAMVTLKAVVKNKDYDADGDIEEKRFKEKAAAEKEARKNGKVKTVKGKKEEKGE